MSRKSWVLMTVACGTFMATLDSSIVNIALPTLTKALSTDLRSIKWVVIVYLLTITCTLLPFGRLSDLYGRQRVFQSGFLIFIVGSALCGASTDLTYLILSRIFQGMGASMLMANGPAIITAAFERKQRGKALGVLSMVVSLGLVSGPSVGGFLIHNFGWRSIFWVNLPIGLLGFVFAHWRLDREMGKSHPGPFDWGGAFLQFILLLSFIFLVDPPTLNAFGSRPFEISVWILALLVFVLGRIFYEVERQVPEPILDFSLFKIRTFAAANLANFLNFVAYSSLLVLMPFYLEEVLDLSPNQAGVLMSAIPLTVFIVAPVSGYLADRFGTRGLSVVGGSISSIVLLSMAGLFGSGFTESTIHPFVLLGLCLVGFASGLFQSPNNVALMSSIPQDKLGVASALMATIRNLGLVTGTGLAAKVFSWKHAETGDFVKAFHAALWVAGILSLGVIGASLLKREEDFQTETDGTTSPNIAKSENGS